MVAKMGYVFGAACCMLLAAAPASGQPASNADAAFQNFLRDSHIARLVNQALLKIPLARIGGCQLPFTLDQRQYTVTEPMSYDAGGTPTAGQWEMRQAANACNRPIVVNVFFTVRSAQDEQIDFGLSGSTMAELAVQQAALPAAYKAAGQYAKNCSTFEAESASFGGYGLPNAPKPASGPGASIPVWWEIWVVRGCGHAFDVPMGFEATTTSTAIHAYDTRVSEHKYLPPAG
jgi:hypothetical protein